MIHRQVIGIEHKMPDKLYRVALGVRLKVLNQSKKNKSQQQLAVAGNCEPLRERLVAGNCGIATGIIQDALQEMGWAGGHRCCGDVKTCQWGWMGHCWLEWRNFVLDVTADQFNTYCRIIKFRPIVFCHKSKLEDIYN